jgi:hypothetical protein
MFGFDPGSAPKRNRHTKLLSTTALKLADGRETRPRETVFSGMSQLAKAYRLNLGPGQQNSKDEKAAGMFKST